MTTEQNDALLNECTRTTFQGGTMMIRCKLGFWSCSGRDHDQVKREARHYFALYYSDGEYDEMLRKAGISQKMAAEKSSNTLHARFDMGF